MDRDRFGEGREIAEWIESQGESVVLRVRGCALNWSRNVMLNSKQGELDLSH